MLADLVRDNVTREVQYNDINYVDGLTVWDPRLAFAGPSLAKYSAGSDGI